MLGENFIITCKLYVMVTKMHLQDAYAKMHLQVVKSFQCRILENMKCVDTNGCKIGVIDIFIRKMMCTCVEFVMEKNYSIYITKLA